MIQLYDLPDITTSKSLPSKSQWKSLVKRKIKSVLELELKDQMKKPGGKLEGIDTNEEKFRTQPYLTNLNLEEARTKFKLRSKMLEVKDNYKGIYKTTTLNCDSCLSSYETQDHILFCPAYIELRKDKDINSDKDLVNYVRQVMKLKDDLKKRT